MVAGLGFKSWRRCLNRIYQNIIGQNHCVHQTRKLSAKRGNKSRPWTQLRTFLVCSVSLVWVSVERVSTTSNWDYWQPYHLETARALWQIDNALLGWRLQEVLAREPWSSLELPTCFHPYPDGCWSWSVAPDHDRCLAARTCCARTRVRTDSRKELGFQVGLEFWGRSTS